MKHDFLKSILTPIFLGVLGLNTSQPVTAQQLYQVPALGMNSTAGSNQFAVQLGATKPALATIKATDDKNDLRDSSGDVNGDGKVDCADLAIVKASLGRKSGEAGFAPRADVNQDNLVDIKDVALVARQIPTGIKCP